MDFVLIFPAERLLLNGFKKSFMNAKVILAGLSVLLLASCTSGTSSTSKGTGTYPNSTYTASGSQDIQSAVFGAPNGKPNLKIFTDYQCPACIMFHQQTEEKLWKDYIEPGKITVSFLNYPLTFTNPTTKRAFHENAEGDALAALCALADGKYREYRDGLYQLEDAKKGARVTDAERVAKAKEIGLDEAAFSACLTGAKYQKALEREIAQGNQLGLEGTPSSYLNDAYMNHRTSEEFFKLLDAAIATSKK